MLGEYAYAAKMRKAIEAMRGMRKALEAMRGHRGAAKRLLKAHREAYHTGLGREAVLLVEGQQTLLEDDMC